MFVTHHSPLPHVPSVLCSSRLRLVIRLDRPWFGVNAGHLDLSCLCLLALRKANTQNSILELSRCAVRGYRLRQGKGPGKFAIRALYAVIVVALSRFLKFAFSPEREHVIFE